jgi:hypothetical protein
MKDVLHQIWDQEYGSDAKHSAASFAPQSRFHSYVEWVSYSI